jgi:hypothetical protein
MSSVARGHDNNHNPLNNNYNSASVNYDIDYVADIDVHDAGTHHNNYRRTHDDYNRGRTDNNYSCSNNYIN